jgi:hypothetical protein
MAAPLGYTEEMRLVLKLPPNLALELNGAADGVTTPHFVVA